MMSRRLGQLQLTRQVPAQADTSGEDAIVILPYYPAKVFRRFPRCQKSDRLTRKQFWSGKCCPGGKSGVNDIKVHDVKYLFFRFPAGTATSCRRGFRPIEIHPGSLRGLPRSQEYECNAAENASFSVASVSHRCQITIDRWRGSNLGTGLPCPAENSVSKTIICERCQIRSCIRKMTRLSA